MSPIRPRIRDCCFTRRSGSRLAVAPQSRSPVTHHFGRATAAEPNSCRVLSAAISAMERCRPALEDCWFRDGRAV